MENPCQALQATEFLWTKFQKQKKLLVNQILKFGYNFFKIGGLWFTYFNVFGKPLRRATSNKIFLGQSSETKKLLRNQILNFGFDVLKIDKHLFMR